MPSYEQLPGILNLSFRAGDDFSAMIDFSIPLTGYSVVSSLNSIVSGVQIAAFTVAFANAAAGQVNISLTDTQTAALARGTYAWSLSWTEGSVTRTALTGFAEVQ